MPPCLRAESRVWENGKAAIPEKNRELPHPPSYEEPRVTLYGIRNNATDHDKSARIKNKPFLRILLFQNALAEKP